MKKLIWIVVLSSVIALILTLSIYSKPNEAHGEAVQMVEPAKAEIPEPPKDPLSRPQRAWLGALEWCESRGNPDALNPKDRDGTPSYGILQFKPGTFAQFAERYGIDKGDGYKDPDAQEAIVEQMIVRGDVRWSQQFPDCTKKLGTPPKLSTPRIDKK